MVIGIKDIFKLAGIIIISACAVFVCTLFMSYNIELSGIEELIETTQNPQQARVLYDALVMTGKVVISVSGGCLVITAVIMLCFYIKHYIDFHRKALGILKALGYSNIRIASGFWVFGFSVFLGAALGFGAAYCIMPAFYSTQNDSGPLPEFGAEFHPELLLFLVILPTAAFALLSVLYGFLKMKTPVLKLLKGGGGSDKVRTVKGKDDLPFLRDMKNATVRGKKSLVFFIAFAAFCYSAMVQMSFGMEKLSSEMMGIMIFLIGIVLAFTTLFISVTSIVSANGKSICIMRVFGYSQRECRNAVFGGYRPAALIGFAIGTIYQYFLLKIMVTVVFKDMDNLPDYNFNVKALVIALISFVLVYEIIIYIYGKKITNTSIKEIMTDSE